MSNSEGARAVTSASQGQIAWRTLRKNPTAMIALMGLIALIGVAIFAPALAPFDPTKLDTDHLLEAPSATHWWGTDDLGRDIFTRVLWGGRESLRVSFLGVLIALIGGTFIGLVSGYYGGAIDFWIQRFVEIFLAFPSVLLVLSIIAVLGPGLNTVLIALGISVIPGYSRVVRSSVLAAKNLEYVAAARVVGAKNMRIMGRHLLPNIFAPIIIYSTLGLGQAILITAGLSYIGLGAQPPSPEWGAMLNYGRAFLRQAWWMSIFPGAAIFVAVLCVNLLGDGLRDALDPKLRL